MESKKVVLVTGSTSTIGLQLIEYLAAQGCIVYAGARNTEKLTKKVNRQLIRAAVKVFGAEVVSMVGSLASAACGPACVAYWNYEFTRAMGGSSSQAFKAGAIAGATAFAFQQVGEYYKVEFGIKEGFGFADLQLGQQLQWAGTHAVVGGISSVASGGKFGHGFISAGFTKMAMGNAGFNMSNRDWSAIAGRTAVAAVIGGTASALTGGKFANGAKTAAMMHLLNAEAPSAWERAKWSYKIQHDRNNLRRGADATGALRRGESTTINNSFYPKGTFVVVAHGNEDGIGLIMYGIPVSEPAEIKAWLTMKGYKGDRPIFLNSCYSGTNGVAQTIADLYPTQYVIAPSQGITNLTQGGGFYSTANSEAYYKEFRAIKPVGIKND